MYIYIHIYTYTHKHIYTYLYTHIFAAEESNNTVLFHDDFDVLSVSGAFGSSLLGVYLCLCVSVYV